MRPGVLNMAYLCTGSEMFDIGHLPLLYDKHFSADKAKQTTLFIRRL